MTAGEPGDWERTEAREAVELAARAIATGELVQLNRLLHPRAAADFARLAEDGRELGGPAITSFCVHDAGGAPRKPQFDIEFRGDGFRARIRVTAVRGAMRWRIGQVVALEPAAEAATPPAEGVPPEPSGEGESPGAESAIGD